MPNGDLLCGSTIGIIGRLIKKIYFKAGDNILYKKNSNFNTELSTVPSQNIGRIIEAYEILSPLEKKEKDGHTFYKCKCLYCGYEDELTIARMRQIGNKCVHYKTVGEVRIPYSKYFVPWTSQTVRRIYGHMIDRCYNKECKDYKYYGARGITVCKEWLQEPWKFEQWSHKNGYKKGLTIDRIDGNKGYEPLNCQWVSREYNARYTTKNKFITATVTLSLTQWSELLGKKPNFIYNMCKTKSLEYITEYIEEHLLDKKVLAQRSNLIKKQVQCKLLNQEMERRKHKLKKNRNNNSS